MIVGWCCELAVVWDDDWMPQAFCFRKQYAWSLGTLGRLDHKICVEPQFEVQVLVACCTGGVRCGNPRLFHLHLKLDKSRGNEEARYSRLSKVGCFWASLYFFISSTCFEWHSFNRRPFNLSILLYNYFLRLELRMVLIASHFRNLVESDQSLVKHGLRLLAKRKPS